MPRLVWYCVAIAVSIIVSFTMTVILDKNIRKKQKN